MSKKLLALVFVLSLFTVVSINLRPAYAVNILDLTTFGAEGTIGGVVFRQQDLSATGSGNLDSFVKINTNGTTVHGYNTSGRAPTGPPKAPFDADSTLTFTHNLQLSDIPHNANYYELLLDINQQGAGPADINSLLSLDEVKIYLSATGSIYRNDVSTLGDLGALKYDLSSYDWYIKLNNIGGSGQGDMAMYLPASMFIGYSDTTYLYLYSKLGVHENNNDGGEEWAVRTDYTSIPFPEPIPEPATISLLGFGLLGLAFRKRTKA